MLKKIIAGVAAGMTVVMLATSPSLAGTFGSLETFNSTGGTTPSNGIKIDYAAGSVQVTRNGYQQVYPSQADVDNDPSYYCGTGVLPDPDQQGCVSSAFVVTLVSDGNYGFGPVVIGAPDPYGSLNPATAIDYFWDEITTTSDIAADGSGTIHSVLTYTFDWCNDSCSGFVRLDVDLSYTYPNQYYTVETATSWNGGGSNLGNDWYARTYYYQDATLSGDDHGNQFSDMDADGNKLVGVIRPDGTALEGVRSYDGFPIATFAGEYSCPLDSTMTECTDDASAGGWIVNGNNLPNSISTTDDLDNGFSVQSYGNSMSLVNMLTTPMSGKFDLLFMACEITSPSATGCIEKGGYVPADTELANTGVDSASVFTTALGTFALVMVGAALMVIRRRRNA